MIIQKNEGENGGVENNNIIIKLWMSVGLGEKP